MGCQDSPRGAYEHYDPRLLDDRRRVLGEDHPHTLAARNNLADALA